MKTKAVVLLAAVLAFGAGWVSARLSHPPAAYPPLPVAAAKPEMPPIPATEAVEGTGVLLADYNGVQIRMHVGEDYGTMLFNDGESREDPRPRYLLLTVAGQTRLETADPKVFAAALAKLPPGSVIHHYDTCEAGTHYGLTEPQMDAWRSMFSDAGLILKELDHSICTCPSTGY